MKDRLYYISENDIQIGPLSLDELKNKKLKKSTLVWYDGLSDWTEAIYIDELKSLTVAEPPPIKKQQIHQNPQTTDSSESAKKNEISGTINVIPKFNKPNTIFNFISNKEKILLIVWMSIHFFIFILSSNGVKHFNTFYEINSDKFWPFVEYYKSNEYYVNENGHRSDEFKPIFGYSEKKEEKHFKGIFTDYDFSEFIFYCTLYLVVQIIILYARKSNW